MSFIGSGLAALDAQGKTVVDLFAGSCAIAAGFGDKYRVVSNDIQQYSAVIAGAYLYRAEKLGKFDLVALASDVARGKIHDLPEGTRYYNGASLAEFNRCEKKNRTLWEEKFSTPHYLFTQTYSGTWWSAEQCICIDAMRAVLDNLRHGGSIVEADFDLGMTCLLHAVAEISTNATSGHYAQYREAKDEAGAAAITKCRLAKLWTPFNKMLGILLSWQAKQTINLEHQILSLDYRECLQKIEKSVVYADPLHAAVQYARSYHAMETLVCYDYPELQRKKNSVMKGRYRADLHESPFGNKAQVRGAFLDMFEGVKASKSDLLLSYSKSDMIGRDELVALATTSFGESYHVWVSEIDYSLLPTGGRGLKKADLDWLITAKKL